MGRAVKAVRAVRAVEARQVAASLPEVGAFRAPAVPGLFRIPPATGPLRGELAVPGDKSISHRALILAALVRDGTSRVRGLASGADVASTADCLRRLGVEIRPDGDYARVTPGAVAPAVVVIPPRGGLRPPAGPLDAGNSGTTARLLAGALAGQPFRAVLTGDASLRRRPMLRVAEPLARAGAGVALRGEGGGCLPLAIRGPIPPRPLAALTHRLPVASAQVKSCLLLAGLHAAGRTTVIEPFPSRDHTERMLGAFGARVRTSGPGASRPPGSLPGAAEPFTAATPVSTAIVGSDGFPRLSPVDLEVPGDFSSAAFWIVAALLVPGSQVLLRGVGVNPTRTGLLSVLARMGAGIGVDNARALPGGEPVADVRVGGPSSGPRLRATTITAAEIPLLIDEVPVLAVAATQAQGVTVFEGAGELRHKETDRLEALAFELGHMGAEVEAEGDRLVVRGPTPLRPARVFSHGDHRTAMALAVAALAAGGGGGGGGGSVGAAGAAGVPGGEHGAASAPATEIRGFDAVAVSYPEFGDHLEALLS